MPRKPREKPPADESPTAPAEGSGAGSSTSSSSSPYTADPGPGFDASKPPANAEERPADVDGEELLEEWQLEQVQSWLRNTGDLAHATVGVGELDWAMTKADLERIGPPLTRILNRYQPARAVAQFSDPASVAFGFGLYGWRSALERNAVLKAAKQQEEGTVAPASTIGAPPAPAPAPADNGATSGTWADQLRATRGEQRGD